MNCTVKYTTLIFRLFFWFKGQIDRKTYLLSNFALYIICIIAADGNLPVAVLYMIIVLLLYSSVCLHIKRLKDTNFRFSEWRRISSIREIRRAIYFLPIYILFVCCFRKGIDDENESIFKIDPLEHIKD